MEYDSAIKSNVILSSEKIWGWQLLYKELSQTEKEKILYVEFKKIKYKDKQNNTETD